MLSVFTNCVMDGLCFFKFVLKSCLMFRLLSTMCMNWLTNGTRKDALLGASFWFRSLVRMAGQRQLTQNYCHNFHWQDEVTIDKTACCGEHQWSFQQITTKATPWHWPRNGTPVCRGPELTRPCKALFQSAKCVTNTEQAKKGNM